MTDLPSMLDLGIDIADAAAPEPLPPGQYPAELRAALPKESTSGSKYLSMQFYISPEDYPADYDHAENPDGVTLNAIGAWPSDGKDKRGVYRLRKLMESLEVPFQGGKVDLDEWVGKKAVVHVGHETYEGETRARINRITKDI